MKALTLIHNARTKNARLEYSESTGLIGMNMIGVCFNRKHTWHWFDVWEDGTVIFDHSYSCNTGKVRRGLRHRMTIQEYLGFYK